MVATSAGTGARARALPVRSLPVGGSHSQFAHVFVRMEHDDVHFGKVEAHERHRSAQAHRQAHGRDLNLLSDEKSTSNTLNILRP